MTNTKVEFTSYSPENTQAFGKRMGQMAKENDVFLLTGTLGAGKTCLTQGIVWGLGCQEYARSPTFILATTYQGRLPIYHLDLFRIENSLDLLDIGIEEYLEGEGVCIIEWADKTNGIFPLNSIKIHLEYTSVRSHRKITIVAPDTFSSDLMAGF
jgi:tRNA threonylcarbamoyladenosine biosynthesis protein TsaE